MLKMFSNNYDIILNNKTMKEVNVCVKILFEIYFWKYLSTSRVKNLCKDSNNFQLAVN